MHWATIEGHWKEFEGKVKSQWGMLTDDPLDVVGGRRDQLTGKIQESHGVSKREAGEQLRQFEKIGRPAARSN